MTYYIRNINATKGGTQKFLPDVWRHLWHWCCIEWCILSQTSDVSQTHSAATVFFLTLSLGDERGVSCISPLKKSMRDRSGDHSGHDIHTTITNSIPRKDSLSVCDPMCFFLNAYFVLPTLPFWLCCFESPCIISWYYNMIPYYQSWLLNIIII